MVRMGTMHMNLFVESPEKEFSAGQVSVTDSVLMCQSLDLIFLGHVSHFSSSSSIFCLQSTI